MMISQNIRRRRAYNPPQKFEPKNHNNAQSQQRLPVIAPSFHHPSLIFAQRNHFTILLFHTVRPSLTPPPLTPSTQRPGEKCGRGGAGAKQAESKLSLRTVIPGRVFWVGCTQDCGSQRALSSRNTTAEETKIIPPPPTPIQSPREMLYFLRRPLRFPPFARLSIFRRPPLPFPRSFAFPLRRAVEERGVSWTRPRSFSEMASGENKVK